MNGAVAILLALLAALVLWRLLEVNRWLCRRLGLLRANFRGDRIPGAAGLGYLAVLLPAGGTLWLADAPLRGETLRILWVALAFGLLGLADDLWGTPAARGFRGHLRALVTGRPTTGALKLIGGGMAALIAARSLHSDRSGWEIFPVLADTLLIAMAANAINLLDVRPGRAQFGFALLLTPSIAAALLCRDARAFAPLLLLGVVARGWRDDAWGRAMLGDTGANLLGAVAGLAAAEILPFAGRLALLALLLALNGAAERSSLSERIAGTPWLAALDRRLGVR